MDFGASDGPMNESQIQAVDGNVLHVPTVLGAVAVTYNLPALGNTQLKFDGNLLVDIFMGRITNWKDPRIAAISPGVKLPDQDLIVVHRSDGSGTTYVFTDYSNKFSREWKDKVGYATSVNWPVGLGAKGNEGVTQQIKQTEGALGYVELIYAISNKLPYAQIKNAAGNFITSPSRPNGCFRPGPSHRSPRSWRWPGWPGRCSPMRWRLSSGATPPAGAKSAEGTTRWMPCRDRCSVFCSPT